MSSYSLLIVIAVGLLLVFIVLVTVASVVSKIYEAVTVLIDKEGAFLQNENPVASRLGFKEGDVCRVSNGRFVLLYSSSGEQDQLATNWDGFMNRPSGSNWDGIGNFPEE